MNNRSQPFPWPLRWALIASPVALGGGYLAEQLSDGGRNPLLVVLTFALWGPGMLGALIAGPIAIVLLWRERPRYTTRGNIALVLFNAFPLFLVLALAFIVTFGRVHF